MILTKIDIETEGVLIRKVLVEKNPYFWIIFTEYNESDVITMVRKCTIEDIDLSNSSSEFKLKIKENINDYFTYVHNSIGYGIIVRKRDYKLLKDFNVGISKVWYDWYLSGKELYLRNLLHGNDIFVTSR